MHMVAAARLQVVQNVFLRLECRHRDGCATGNAIVNNTLFQSSSYVNRMMSQIAHFALLSGRLVAQDFLIN